MTSTDQAAFTPPLREVELVPFDDLVGRQEIAERQQVTVSAIDTWRRRYKTFPEPATTLSGTPIWRWSEVARWIRSTPRKAGRPKKLVRA